MLWLLQLYLYLLLCIPLLQVYHLMFNKNKIRIKKNCSYSPKYLLSSALLPLCFLLFLAEHTRKEEEGEKRTKLAMAISHLILHVEKHTTGVHY